MTDRATQHTAIVIRRNGFDCRIDIDPTAIQAEYDTAKADPLTVAAFRFEPNGALVEVFPTWLTIDIYAEVADQILTRPAPGAVFTSPVAYGKTEAANVRYWEVINVLAGLAESTSLPMVNPDIDLLGQGEFDSLGIVEFMLACEDEFPGLKTDAQEDYKVFSGPLKDLATWIVGKLPNVA